MKNRIHTILLGILPLVVAGCGRGQSAGEACIAKLKQIEGATYTWAQDNKKGSNDMITWADLVGPDRYLRTIPQCPHGGTYTITRVGELPACSIPEDTAYFRTNR